MWNLVKGRCTYTAPLEEEAQHVAFDSEGGMYALLTGNKLTVFSTVLVNNDDDGVVAVFSYERRLLCMTWVTKGDGEKTLLAGGEDGSIHILRLTNNDNKKTLQHGSIKRAHATRIKGIAVVVNPSSSSSSILCGSAASDGVIKLWNLTTIIGQLKSSPSLGDSILIDGDECVMSEARTTARLTSLCALDSKSDMEAGAKLDTHRKKQHTQQQNAVNSNKTNSDCDSKKKKSKGGGRKRKAVEVVEKKKEEEEERGGGDLVNFVTKEELETMKKKQQHRVQTVQAKKKNMAKKQNRERQEREGE